MTTRRDFIKQAVAASVASNIPFHLLAQEKPVKNMIWANLLHLSYNMWNDHIPLQYRDSDCNCTTCKPETTSWANGYRPNLTFDEDVWNALLKDMVAQPLVKLIVGNSNVPMHGTSSLEIGEVSCSLRSIIVVEELVSVSVALYLG